MSDAVFFTVPLNSYMHSSCSPPLDPGQSGLRIAAPTRILAQTHDTLPVCGTLRLSARKTAELREPIERVTFVLVNKATDEAVTFTLRPDKDPLEEDPSSELDLESFDDTDLRENYFNVDLRSFSSALQAPLQPGNYALYAVLETYTSNVVQFEVDGEGDSP